MAKKEIYGFRLIKSQQIAALNIEANYYRHIATGAELLSVESDDENKVFGITFRTPPKDSTGIAHIMEHSVLCGSRKYPVKEPFIELVKGSLSTFLNAFTYPDKTCYPVASQNLKDFYNLIDVYMDAVFFPLLSEYTFMQEGWHYEIEAIDDPLRYKGVVYNEMKGAYSDPDNLLSRWVQHSLFPDHIYGIDSGGDPNDIPELTYNDFMRFHEYYYNPSNAYIYFFGNDDPNERLRMMDRYLSEKKALMVDSRIPDISNQIINREYVYKYDAGKGDSERKGGYFVRNWLVDSPPDATTALGLRVLAHILLGSPASPLRKALIESGYGEDLASVGLETELKYMYFSTGLKGIEIDDRGNLKYKQEIDELIESTLLKLVEEGIDSETVEASLNTVEFQLRENNSGAFPQGLVLMLRALTNWIYDRDPIEILDFEKPLEQIRKVLSRNGNYFEELIKKFFLDNPNQTRLSLLPEKGYQKRIAIEEKKKLEEIKKNLSKSEIEKLIQINKELKRRQGEPDSPENLAKMPSLAVDDLDTKNKIIPIQEFDLYGSRGLFHDIFTNGIVYLDIGFNIHFLPVELLPYVPLFGRGLIEMGTDDENYVKFSQRIGRLTGGFSTTIFSTLKESDRKETVWLFLRGKATVAHAQDMIDILKDMLSKVLFDNKERFLQMLLEEKASVESSLVPYGHRFVNGRLRSKFNLSDQAAERMSGIEYIYFLRRLVEMVKDDWKSVHAVLEEIRSLLMNREAILFNVTLDEKSFTLLEPKLQSLVEVIPTNDLRIVDWPYEGNRLDEGFIIPAKVNYVGKGANLYELGFKPSGSIDVIANYLRTTYLWEQVRVKGGAYGGFCVFDRHTGIFNFLSYRDPNLLETIYNYDKAAEHLLNNTLEKEVVARSIIGAIGSLDTYQLPDAKGYTSMVYYLSEETEEQRQLRRDQILRTTQNDFRSFAEELAALNQHGSVVIMGSKQAFDELEKERRNWLEIRGLM